MSTSKPVCVPAEIGALAVWRQNNIKIKNPEAGSHDPHLVRLYQDHPNMLCVSACEFCWIPPLFEYLQKIFAIDWGKLYVV